MQNQIFENGKPLKQPKNKSVKTEDVNLLLNYSNDNTNNNKLTMHQEKLLNSLLENDYIRLEKKKNTLITKLLNNNI